MYETFFGLKRRPFLAVPDTDLFFSTSSISETRQTVERIVRRGEGISLVFGESGTGKTLLLRMLRKSLDVEYTVSLLFNSRLETPKAFLQQLLFDLRLPFANADETELRLALWDFARQETTPGLVLLVDDAQHLNISVLEEIRLLMNCDDGAVPFFRVVLAGTSELEENLTDPSLDAFNQRVVSRSYLDTLTREETANYVSWQTNVSCFRGRENSAFEHGLNEFVDNSGRLGDIRRLDTPHGSKSESIFTDGAKRLIYQLTDGLPRLINQLCDAALILAAERIARSVDESLIQTAWTQLQQLTDEPLSVPSDVSVPTNDDSPKESLDELIARKKSTLILKEFDSSIEFGTLDDSESEKNASPSTVRSPNEYKPPYPEDDWETDAAENHAPSEEPIRLSDLPVGDDSPSSENDPETESCFVDTEALFCGIESPASVREAFNPELDEALDEMVVGRIGPADTLPDSCVAEESAAEIEEVEEEPELPLPGPQLPVLEVSTLEETALEETALEDTVLEDTTLEDTTLEVADLETISVRRRLPHPVRKRRIEPDVPRKYSKHPFRRNGIHPVSLSLTCRVFEASDDWIACLSTRILLLPVYLSTPPTVAELPLAETAPMDQETLEQYNREVLDGRPPFVRREPHYAYQTTSETPLESESYPHPFYSLPLNWVAPDPVGEHGYGVAYDEFLHRKQAESEYRTDVSSSNVEPTSQPVVSQIPESPVVRLTLTPGSMFALSTTSLDEHFDEWEIVGKRFVPFEEIYRSEASGKQQRNAPVQRPLPDDDELTKKIEAVVLRITQAAEKIERAADVSENAGQLVRRAAEYVETEVQAAIPTYKEFFQELSDFQRTISEEVAVLRMKNEATVAARKESNFLTFPISEGKEPKSSRLGSPQALFEISNVETERRIDAKTLFQ